MEFIETNKAAKPLGHYSQAACQSGFCFVSGILPVAREDPMIRSLSFEEQSDLVLAHAGAILEAAGLTAQHVVSAHVYVTNVEHWDLFNTKYAVFMGSHKPARAVVPVPELHHGFDVELELIAHMS
ncbi:RidA family protein [Leisingera sp.]|uniref:RidA family protein n=1 Tax=Leisingera sp. TaxID=1879318 RepID=UPI002B2660C5|nr:RidA family protein [Leisingera sp.]